MNKLSFLIYILLLTVTTACKTAKTPSTTNVAKTVADEVVAVDDAVKANDFKFLDGSLEGRDIVILGEADHGVGKTFEVKSQLVKYLIEQKGYNTFAFEWRDFFTIEYINGRESLKGVLDESLKQNWVRQWNPWGPAKEIQTLVDVLEAKKVGVIGLEPYKDADVGNAVAYIKSRAVALGISTSDNEAWNSLEDIIHRTPSDYAALSEEQANFYAENLEKVLEKIDVEKSEEMAFLYQMVENVITYIKYKQFPLSLSDNDIVKYTDIRDAQMAKNLIWYKKRNPGAKIIVWAANFHGANNLREVQFADGDPLTYSKFTVFGEHVAKEYGSKVYSMAFTSSRGTSKVPYDFKSIEETVINAPEGSLENYLDQKNIGFGYIDFSDIRKNNPGLINKEFSSIMLGHTNQTGKWLNVFDGLFYIRENHNATPIK